MFRPVRQVAAPGLSQLFPTASCWKGIQPVKDAAPHIPERFAVKHETEVHTAGTS